MFAIFKMNNDTNITIRKEKGVNYSYRNYFDREKDAILLPIVSRDMGLLVGNNMIEKDGEIVGKRDIFCSSCPITPKAFGNMKPKKVKKKKVYIKLLDNFFLKHIKDLEKFKVKKELLVYVCFYLRESKFINNDLDNYIKALLDILKKFIGDDKKIVSLLVEKKGLMGIENIDADFFEQSIIFISTPDAKEDLFKIPKYCPDFLGLINRRDEVKFKGELKINKNDK